MSVELDDDDDVDDGFRVYRQQFFTSQYSYSRVADAQIVTFNCRVAVFYWYCTLQCNKLPRPT